MSGYDQPGGLSRLSGRAGSRFRTLTSALVGDWRHPESGAITCIDVCAAPGGKSLHAGGPAEGNGHGGGQGSDLMQKADLIRGEYPALRV